MPHTVRITVLVENTAQGMGILAEHGLAWWIEWGDRRLLFDTGQGAVLVSNAYKLGVSVRRCDAVAISHGHYDHTGGLADVLRNSQRLPVYVHPAALEPKYARTGQGPAREIGIPFPSLRALREHALDIVATESPTTLWDGLKLTGPVPRTTDFEDTGGLFFLNEVCSKPDPLIDDQSLFFEADGGVVVLLGCAHAGVVNTLRYVRELSGGTPFRAVLGGMHLVGASPERVERTIAELRRLEIDTFAPGHCTGTAAVAAIWKAFPGRCATCHVGARFQFERGSSAAMSTTARG